MAETIPQIQKLKLAKNKVNNVVDVTKRLKLGNCINTTHVIAKIVKSYFLIVTENIVNGYEHHLPKNFGSLAITKYRTKSPLGGTYSHRIHWNNDFVARNGMRFEMTKSLKERINNLLDRGSIEYKIHNGS